ncbi:VOC family protein [Modestobacter altitudinis]|uniref:VOC family protein n=1 Tax=Modestobacter altitudinis TaxID=2213158 RepID=UPI00110CAE68|nr:VOC family protein [Modestobacter altitudinis]
MTDTAKSPPAVKGLGHFSITVTDLDASVAWYQRVLALEPLPMKFPHYGSEESGYAVVLVKPDQGWAIGIHRHAMNRGTPADETMTGLDHFALAVSSRETLEAWATWLNEQGVQHSGVIDTTDPMPYSVVVFRDPDNIQLELIHLPG